MSATAKPTATEKPKFSYVEIRVLDIQPGDVVKGINDGKPIKAKDIVLDPRGCRGNVHVKGHCYFQTATVELRVPAN